MECNYFIKPGYKAREANYTLSNEATPDYWEPNRIRMAALYQYQVYRRARQLIEQNHLKSVIDLGCGPGVKLHDLIAPVCSNIVGIDQESAINFCKANWSFGIFYVENLECPTLSLGRTFDLVICSDVLEHLLNPDPLMNYIRELRHAGTYVVFSAPDRDRVRGPHCMESPKLEHVREWNAVEFHRYVEHFGFVVIEHRLVLPQRFTWSVADFRMILSQLKRGRDFRTCQLLVCRGG